MLLNWKRIIEGALITVLAGAILGVMGGAAAIVWQGATSVGEQVESATADLRSTNTEIRRTNQLIQSQNAQIDVTHETLVSELAELGAAVEAIDAQHDSISDTLTRWRDVLESKGQLIVTRPRLINPDQVKSRAIERINEAISKRGGMLTQQHGQMPFFATQRELEERP